MSTTPDEGPRRVAVDVVVESHRDLPDLEAGSLAYVTGSSSVWQRGRTWAKRVDLTADCSHCAGSRRPDCGACDGSGVLSTNIR